MVYIVTCDARNSLWIIGLWPAWGRDRTHGKEAASAVHTAGNLSTFATLAIAEFPGFPRRGHLKQVGGIIAQRPPFGRLGTLTMLAFRLTKFYKRIRARVNDWHDWERAIVGALIMGTISVAGWVSWPDGTATETEFQSASVPEPPANGRLSTKSIFIECRQRPQIKTDRHLFVFRPYPGTSANGASNLDQVFGDGDPRLGRIVFDAEDPYECYITNYAKEPLFGITMNLRAVFREVNYFADGSESSGAPVSDRVLPIVIPKVDVGNGPTWSFAITNQTAQYLRVVFPDSVTGSTADNPTQQVIILRAPEQRDYAVNLAQSKQAKQ